MSVSLRKLRIVSAVAGVLAAVGGASAAQPTTQPVSEQLAVLRARLEQLQTQQKQRAGQDQVAQQQATSKQIISDADSHSSFLDAASGVTAGYVNNKFVIQSEDGSYLFHPWLLFQFQNVTNGREKFKHNGSADWENGFDVHRMKIGFDGNAFGPNLTYLAVWNTSDTTGALVLSEGWAQWKFSDTPFAIKGGQYKDPFNREELVVDQFQMAIERTYLTDLLANGEGFVKAASLIYDNGGPLRAQVAVTGGLRSNNTNFQSFPTNKANYGAAARAEYKVFGNWADYKDFTAEGVKQGLLVFGGGADYTEAGATGVLSYTADAQLKCPCGLALFGALLGRTGHSILNGSIGTNGGFVGAMPHHNGNDWGAEAQVSYALNPQWEPFARYSYIDFNKASLPTGTRKSTYHEITVGLNYYVWHHNIKLVGDASYLPSGAPVSDTAAPSGILANNGHPEWLFRIQAQLWL